MIIRSSVVELLCSCEERRTCVGFNTVSGYTPLVEVNQAIFAWSFRQPCWNISLLPPSGHKLSEVNAKNKQKKSLQHPVFPGGHPSKYSQGSMLLNFSDQTRTGAFNMIWSKTFKIDIWHSVGLLYPLRKCTKLFNVLLQNIIFWNC